MRLCAWAAVALLISAAVGFGEEGPKPDELKKMYDDALVQLKSAQDRKNELAQENEKLAAKVEQMKKELAAANEQALNLRRQIADESEKTFYLRSYNAAWQEFMRRYPELMARWKVYLEGAAFSGPEVPRLVDPAWPLTSDG